MMNASSDDRITNGPSRRTVMGAAWSMPVVAVAAAAPAATASTSQESTAELGYADHSATSNRPGIITLELGLRYWDTGAQKVAYVDAVVDVDVFGPMPAPP